MHLLPNHTQHYVNWRHSNTVITLHWSYGNQRYRVARSAWPDDKREYSNGNDQKTRQSNTAWLDTYILRTRLNATRLCGEGVLGGTASSSVGGGRRYSSTVLPLAG